MRIRILAFLFISLASLTNAQNEPDPVAQEVAQLVLAKKYKKVHKKFSGKIKLFFSKKKFINIWEELESNNGKLLSVGKVSTSKKDGLHISTIPITFENIGLNLSLSTSDKGKIVGFSFLPLDYAPPAWATNKVYGRERITIKTDTFELEGELMLPNNCQNCPVAILVHGSGASDRDGSSGPNKVYRDLAYGLANNGVASIRYDKRSFVYGKSLRHLDSSTLYDEAIYDALSAVKMARSYNFLDSSRIYVIGHSLGAYASPLIAKKIIPEQYEYLFNLDSTVTELEQNKLDRAREEVKLIEGEPTEVTELKELGSQNLMWYHRFMMQYDPIATINSLDGQRCLVMQGDRDYQVRYQTEFMA
ncbi:MAG: DUF3887 domain-containing protein, partial [Bacteroidia bacterium]|nr:DUF3887 domain-containing protein [Bacteroidia bacterium]